MNFIEKPKIVQKKIELVTLFIIGGLVYVCMELSWRGYSHWTMFILGGVCFVIIGSLNEITGRDTPLFPQMVIGSLIVTLLEYITGYIVNIKLGWNIWDYSNFPLNIQGQICLPATFLWMFITLIAIVLDDLVRYKFFGYPKPRYTFF